MNKISNLSIGSDPRTESGFGAALALMMFAFGALSLALVANEAALSYADSADKSIERSQAGLDARACADSADLVRAKDVFAAGDIDIPELHCHVRNH
jgi:hypothetical protein